VFCRLNEVKVTSDEHRTFCLNFKSSDFNDERPGTVKCPMGVKNRPVPGRRFSNSPFICISLKSYGRTLVTIALPDTIYELTNTVWNDLALCEKL